jgi:hypothetical protein
MMTKSRPPSYAKSLEAHRSRKCQCRLCCPTAERRTRQLTSGAWLWIWSCDDGPILAWAGEGRPPAPTKVETNVYDLPIADKNRRRSLISDPAVAADIQYHGRWNMGDWWDDTFDYLDPWGEDGDV